MRHKTSVITIVVDSRIRLPARGLHRDVIAELKAAHTHRNPEIGKRRAMGLSVWRIPETIHTWQHDADEISFPRGGMVRVREILRARKIPFEVRDERSEGRPILRPFKYKGFPLRPHQKDMVRIGLAKQQCIIRGATGSGKSLAAFALAAEIGLNTLIILPNKGLFQQWASWAEKALGIKGDALGVIGGGKKRLRPLTIAMQATLARGVAEDVREFFGAVIVDEAQRVAADFLYRAVDAMPAKYRIAISASERRKDRKEYLIYDLFSKVEYEATREAMTEAGHILDVEIRIIPTSFRAPWYGAENDGVDFNRLLSEMTEDEERNALFYRFADQELARGEKIIALTHRREHARRIEQRFIGSLGSQERTGRLLGELEPGDREDFERAVYGIEKGKVRIGIGTYGALGYGIDLPAVSVGFATTPIATNEQLVNQVRGRLCRPNPKGGKTEGRLYVMVDVRVFGMRPIRNLAAWNGRAVVWGGAKWVDAADYLKGRTFQG